MGSTTSLDAFSTPGRFFFTSVCSAAEHTQLNKITLLGAFVLKPKWWLSVPQDEPQTVRFTVCFLPKPNAHPFQRYRACFKEIKQKFHSFHLGRVLRTLRVSVRGSPLSLQFSWALSISLAASEAPHRILRCVSFINRGRNFTITIHVCWLRELYSPGIWLQGYISNNQCTAHISTFINIENTIKYTTLHTVQ